MSLIELLLIAAGLAADAFAVSVAEGVALDDVTPRHTLRMSLMFGLFQGLMPILGWTLGRSLQNAVGSFDHWVAFGILGFIGGKMIGDAIFGFATEARHEESRGLRLLGLAVATSLDALAIGVSISMLKVTIWTPALVIAVVTAVLCAFGMQAGRRIGTRIGRRAEVVGGIILVCVGVMILIKHLP